MYDIIIEINVRLETFIVTIRNYCFMLLLFVFSPSIDGYSSHYFISLLIIIKFQVFLVSSA